MSKLLHWKKCLACLLAFALCAALLCVGAGASAQSAFSLGDGTEDNPSQTTLEPWERFCSAMQEVGRKVT